jgi:proteasome lid subunit RPN8/RPN11
VSRTARPRLWITESAAASTRAAAQRAHPAETGGVLLGVYVAGARPWIVEAVTVPSAVASGTYYELGRDERPAAVDEARARDARLGYIGDWHSHPADVGPSTVDASTMRHLGADLAAGCPHPVLIVARRGARGAYDLDARQLARWRLRRLQVIMAGALPAISNGTVYEGVR